MTSERPSRVLSVSVTEAGRKLAAQLPFEAVQGDAAATVRRNWDEVDGFVLFLATGAATRIIARLLTDKATDPAVVCVDEAGRFAVALTGGHAGGANNLAREVAALIGAVPVITTATDSAGLVALDHLPGFTARGDIAGVTTAWLDGTAPRVVNEIGWPLPPVLPSSDSSEATTSVVVTDRAVPETRGTVALHPPCLVAGIGASSGAPAEEMSSLLSDALVAAGLERACVAEVATIDIKTDEPGIVALGLPIRSFVAADLATMKVPNPSPTVEAAVGTPSVCEAAALRAAGPGAELVVAKRTSAHATVAIARRRRPRGHLALVGLGPGDPARRTAAATEAVRDADVVIGYERYVDLCRDLLTADHEVVTSPIGDEVLRAKQAVAEAAAGRRVALVCSGDAGIYGMASLTFETAHGTGATTDIDIEVVPGVTAALAAAAALGAPLGHDHATISLSDLLTSWPTIERRVRAAAEADFVVAFYNPRSAERNWQLDAALAILLEHRPASTPAGVVTAATRPTQSLEMTTLAELKRDSSAVNMSSCVIVGSSTSRALGDHIVTPRGYER